MSRGVEPHKAEQNRLVIRPCSPPQNPSCEKLESGSLSAALPALPPLLLSLSSLFPGLVGCVSCSFCSLSLCFCSSYIYMERSRCSDLSVCSSIESGILESWKEEGEAKRKSPSFCSLFGSVSWLLLLDPAEEPTVSTKTQSLLTSPRPRSIGFHI